MNVSFLTLGTNRYAASHHSPSRHSRCITALNEYRGIFFFLSQGQEMERDRGGDTPQRASSWRRTCTDREDVIYQLSCWGARRHENFMRTRKSAFDERDAAQELHSRY